MTDLCHSAKAVPNGEKYKNRFDIRKWCQTRCSSRILGAATVIGIALSKRKNAAIRWDHSVFGTPERIRTAGLPLRSRPDTMKPSATQCKKILGNTRFFTVSNPIWYQAS